MKKSYKESLQHTLLFLSNATRSVRKETNLFQCIVQEKIFISSFAVDVIIQYNYIPKSYELTVSSEMR